MAFNILDLDYCKQNESKIQEHNRLIETLHGLPVSALKRERKTTKDSATFLLRWHRTAAVLRLRLLESGASSAYNSGNFMCSAILVRQMIETAAHFIWIFAEMRKQQEQTPPTVAEITNRLKIALFGSKLKEHSAAIPPEQILNCIDATDKLLKQQKARPIRETYDFLSEFVHPNSYAYLYHAQFLARSEPWEVTFHAQGDAKTANLMSGHIFTGLLILEVFLYCESRAEAVLSSVLRRAE